MIWFCFLQVIYFHGLFLSNLFCVHWLSSVQHKMILQLTFRRNAYEIDSRENLSIISTTLKSTKVMKGSLVYCNYCTFSNLRDISNSWRLICRSVHYTLTLPWHSVLRLTATQYLCCELGWVHYSSAHILAETLLRGHHDGCLLFVKLFKWRN